MKKLFTIILVALATFSQASAQALITNESLTREKRKVTVNFDIDSRENSVSSKMKEVLVPFIYNGTDTTWLSTVEVYGKGRFKRERQTNHINGNKDWTLGERQVIKGDVYTYTDVVDVEPWMASANLAVRRYIVGCSSCGDDKYADIYVTEQNLYPIPPYVITDASRKWDFGQDELEVIFKVSKIEIDSTVFDNEITFEHILAAVDKIHSNPNYKIEKIQVSGYASPEGAPEIVNGEENWSGLRKILVASNMDKKDEVIAIIDDTEIQGEDKKIKIKNIDGGRTWQKMLREIYPHLRSARYLSVYYDSTDDNAVEIINKANSLIRENRFEEAYEMAIQVSSDMRAHNTIGVALMGQGKFQEAKAWFKKALDGNCPSAQKNIDAIEAEYGY